MKPTRQPFRSFLLLAATLVIITSPAVVNAQSKCDAGKLKEYAKRTFCLVKVDAQSVRKGASIDRVKETRCIDKFTEKCAKAELQGDCTSYFLSCAQLVAESNMCRDAPFANCEDYGGVEIGRACWFLGASGDDCDTTCVAAGLAYDTATASYAGSGGTAQHCVAVLDALSVPAGSLTVSGICLAGVGCASEPGSSGRIRCSDPPTTSDSFLTGVNRACACQ